ncbi:MAG: hypothetical protein IKP71_09780, partial [Candidatus Riflebacteria bacterium]|nr:hypothetical protein [Candidatus Riflebacteria bacterium]
ALAQRIASELQQPYVGTEHILLALLKTNASVPEAVMLNLLLSQVQKLLLKNMQLKLFVLICVVWTN